MPAPTHILADQLVDNLSYLCAQPSTSGHNHELAATARVVSHLMHRAGLEVKIVPTAGAPVVFGWRTGRLPFTLLLYHHYDVAPCGPWRSWLHEPFRVAERENNLYARGVAHGKGPLIAHLQAIQMLLKIERELPHGLIIVAEGERLIGSPHLAGVVRQYTSTGQVHACLSSGGERDAEGRPFCYSGSKGLLQVRLGVLGSSLILPPGLAASVSNPLWRLIWALAEVKGVDEDIRINGFYDKVEGPGREERTILRQVQLNEAERLEAWRIPEFLFGMTGATLVRTEATLPTCNVASLNVSPCNDISCIPTTASARLDFQLVPNQHPDEVFHQLKKHLAEKNFHDVVVEKISGGYAPIQSSRNQPFLQRLVESGERVYGAPLNVLPLGPFSQPLHIFSHYLDTPVASLAVARHDSSEYGPNEHLPLEDLIQHGQMLIEIMTAESTLVRAVAMAEDGASQKLPESPSPARY